MSMLEQTQTRFMAALDGGPHLMPFDLFAGSPERALLGMKVHANTVSHARLVALEDTFPRTRALLGDERFNHLCRNFLDWPGTSSRTLTTIGRDFPRFLALAADTATASEVAAFEWAWLTCYHAADAAALTLADLAGLDEAALAAVVIDLHPAALLGPNSGAICTELGAELPDLAKASGLLLVRPAEEIVALAADHASAAIFRKLSTAQSIGNLFAACTELEYGCGIAPEAFMPALIGLIGAGALQRVK